MSLYSLLGHRIPLDGSIQGSAYVAAVTSTFTSAKIGGWYGMEFFGYRNRSVEVYGTFVATYNVEITLDPNGILVDNNGNIKSGAVGHADISTIPSKAIVTGATSGDIYDLQQYMQNANIVAVRINVTGYTSGTLQASMTVAK